MNDPHAQTRPESPTAADVQGGMGGAVDSTVRQESAVSPNAETVLAMPQDARARASSPSDSVESTGPDSIAWGTEPAASESSVARDRLLAKLIVDRDLASEEEVRGCIERLCAGGYFAKRKTFGQLLVERRVVTPNQLMRLQQHLVTQRSARTIPGFKMLGKLGKGTNASVYKARQLNLDRLVAIKVLPSGSLGSSKVVEQFYAEGRAAARLNHANIVQAFDVGACADFHYFVMEYVEGKTVHDVLVDVGAYDALPALELVIPVARALAHAHERGLVHRDVKPKNIILDSRGVPKLADLGLARVIADREAGLAEMGHALGTPYYISPEQVRGELEIGPPADVYGLGATFYHMVTGGPPFVGKDAREVMEKHLSSKHLPVHSVVLGFNAGLSEVIDKMMNKSPADRYPSAEELLVELEAWHAVLKLERGEQRARGS